jgi:Flp pilus assembly protein TadB
MSVVVLLAAGVLLFVLVLRMRRRRSRRAMSADALATALGAISPVGKTRWNPRAYKGRWWL